MRYFFDEQQGGNSIQRDKDRTQEHVRTDQQMKNVETAVNNPDYYDDDYASQQEDKISSDEAKSEKAQRPGS